MQELITITTGGQGSPVVSARELYDFLGFDNSQWSRWSKKNIVNNPYGKENEDWEGFDTMSNGNPTKDYALTLDFAKRLSMLARTEKGEEARRYFLECEKKATAGLSVEQVLLQQAHTLVEQGNLIAQLRAEVDSIKQSYPKPRPVLAPPHLKHTPALSRPAPNLREAVRFRVNEYCGYHGVEQGETYTYLYKRLNEVYGINAYRLIRSSGENLLSAIERYGHLDKIHSLVMRELNYAEQ